MTGPTLFLVIAGLTAVTIVVQLRSGKITLFLAPSQWKNVERQTDPRRFFMFVVAELVVLIGSLCEGFLALR